MEPDEWVDFGSMGWEVVFKPWQEAYEKILKSKTSEHNPFHHKMYEPIVNSVEVSSGYDMPKYEVGFVNPEMSILISPQKTHLVTNWLNSAVMEPIGDVSITGCDAWIQDSSGDWSKLGYVTKAPVIVVVAHEFDNGGFLSDHPNFQDAINAMWQYEKTPKPANQAMEAIKSLKESMPGISERVMCPQLDCTDMHLEEASTKVTIWDMVQHLNDRHKWTREAIADWLETLDVDLSFPVPDDIPKEPGEE